MQRLKIHRLLTVGGAATARLSGIALHADSNLVAQPREEAKQLARRNQKSNVQYYEFYSS